MQIAYVLLICSLHMCIVHTFCTQNNGIIACNLYANCLYATCLCFVYAFIARVHSAHILQAYIACNLNAGCIYAICIRFAYVHLAHMQYAHKQHVCNK